MARPESEPLTELGKRLRLLRKSLGVTEQKQFAQIIGVSASAMSDYERGKREATSSAVAACAQKFGVNLNWLLNGEGEMFTDPSKAPISKEHHTIKPEVFRAVGRLVTDLNKVEGIKLPPDALLDEQSSAYNALIERAEDPSDTDELNSLLPWLETRLKRKLLSAKAEPGTGKRPAS